MIRVLSLFFNKGIYEVTFTNGEVLRCNEELILKYRLVKDKEITEETFLLILEDSKWYHFYQKAINYLSRGLKSSYKVYLYLKEKEVSDEEIIKVIELLKKNNILNDGLYFETLTEQYIRNGYGSLYIKQKGLLERIDSAIISDILSKVDRDMYVENAMKLYIKKKSINQANLTYNEKQKIKRYLYSRGYDFDIIEIVMREESR